MNDKTTLSGSTKSQLGRPIDTAHEFAADLSAWMDGEISGGRARLVAQGMMADPSMRALWSRYHLIGDVLRDNVPASGIVDLSAGIRSAIDQDESDARVSRVPFVNHPRAWGLAASLVLASVILVNSWQRPGTPHVDIAAGPDAAPAVVATADAEPERAETSELDQYLRNHTLALVDTGEPARMLPYLSMAESAGEPVSATAP